jgi:hypothetical protein
MPGREPPAESANLTMIRSKLFLSLDAFSSETGLPKVTKPPWK